MPARASLNTVDGSLISFFMVEFLAILIFALTGYRATRSERALSVLMDRGRSALVRARTV